MSVLETKVRTTYPGIWNVNPALIEWTEIAANPGNFLKVLTIDEPNHRVDFLFRQDPHRHYTKHRHLCAVATLTLEGEWGYREGDEKLFKGCFSYETPGTVHTPYASEQGMVVYASFQGTGPVLLDLLDDNDEISGHLDLDFFKGYFDG